MAKNCCKCSLPFSSEDVFMNCLTCKSNLIHKSCVNNTYEEAQSCSTNKQWKCSTCETDGSEEKSASCDTCSPYVSKLDDLLLRINALQQEQNIIVNSIINTCNDTLGEYEESINGLTSLLSSFQLQLDDFNNDTQIDESDTGAEEGRSSMVP